MLDYNQTKPQTGETRTIDGVEFEYWETGGYDGRWPTWRATRGDLAHNVYAQEAPEGFRWRPAGGKTTYFELDVALRAAIRNRRREVERARVTLAHAENSDYA